MVDWFLGGSRVDAAVGVGVEASGKPSRDRLPELEEVEADVGVDAGAADRLLLALGG